MDVILESLLLTLSRTLPKSSVFMVDSKEVIVHFDQPFKITAKYLARYHCLQPIQKTVFVGAI